MQDKEMKQILGAKFANLMLNGRAAQLDAWDLSCIRILEYNNDTALELTVGDTKYLIIELLDDQGKSQIQAGAVKLNKQGSNPNWVIISETQSILRIISSAFPEADQDCKPMIHVMHEGVN